MYLLLAYCSSTITGNTCYVVHGFTSIRFDGENAAMVQTIAYDAIEMALNDPHFLEQFVEIPFTRLDFIEPVRESLVLLPEEATGSNPTSKAAIAAVVVSLVLACIFMAGLLRRHVKAKKAIKKKKLTESGTKNRFLLGAPPRKSYYILNDEFKEVNKETTTSSAGIHQVVDINTPISPTITWSVSDITSESGSIISSISRTTSKLERIEEEHESQSSEEWDSKDTSDFDLDPKEEEPVPLELLYGLNGRQHARQWDIHPLEGKEERGLKLDNVRDSPGYHRHLHHHVEQYDVVEVEPQGCRFLDESQETYEYYYQPTYKMECSQESSGLNPSAVESQQTPSDHNMIDVSSDEIMIISDDEDEEEDEYDDNYMEDTSVDDLNMSDDTVLTLIGHDEEKMAVLQERHAAVSDISDEAVHKWMVDLIKELRKAQNRLLLTNE